MKRLVLLLTLLIPFFTFSQIINIPGDYHTIQEGINATSTGDTVLVDTGTYVENIYFLGKNITVASHYLTTLDTSYISQTIIDGNHTGSVVYFLNAEDSTTLLCGFTIQNGAGYFDVHTETTFGGGIYCNGSSPSLKNLIITNNQVDGGGGGIFILSSQPTLTNIIAKNNTSNRGRGGGISIVISQVTFQNVMLKNNSSLFGGGISIGSNCNLIFDSIHLCSIYSNHAAVGKDIYSSYPVEIYLDTFSVATPTNFYASPLQNFNLHILNNIVELIDVDLYVSPDGDNDNDGLSEETPLKTIYQAFSMILADSLHQHTVYLLEGTYGEYNAETFPVYIPDYIHLKGVDENNVVLDCSGTFESVVYFNRNSSTKLSGLTITGGKGMNGRSGGGIYCSNTNLNFENLIIKGNGTLEYGGGIYIRNGSDVTLKNLTITDNRSEYGGGGAIYCQGSDVYIENSSIKDNGGSDCILVWFSSNIIFKNVLIANNESGVIILQSNAHLINTTITGHEVDEGYGGISSSNSGIISENTIFWNNTPTGISFGENWDGTDTIYISYSNIEGGEEGININDSTTVYWLEGNIDQDPIFVALGDNPYQINDYSPCIDAGTPDTTGLNLPEYDLAGELRIFNERVDIGAYEWNTFVGIEESSMPDRLQLQVNTYPNPFTTSTTIEYELIQPETVRIIFYNQFGKLVDVIEESQLQGLNKVVWTPENLPDGIYYFRLQAGEEMATGKMVKID